MLGIFMTRAQELLPISPNAVLAIYVVVGVVGGLIAVWACRCARVGLNSMDGRAQNVAIHFNDRLESVRPEPVEG